MAATTAQNWRPSIGSDEKVSERRVPESTSQAKNSERLSTFGCSRSIFDSMVEPHRPVPTMKMEVLIALNPSGVGAMADARCQQAVRQHLGMFCGVPGFHQTRLHPVLDDPEHLVEHKPVTGKPLHKADVAYVVAGKELLQIFA